MNAKQLFLHALTPLHAGIGQGIDFIDQPIAREAATNLPYLPGSSLKGVLRDRANGSPNITKIFGPDTTNADDHAGAVQFTDQRLLLLPVRSLAGTFAWATSPFILNRFRRDCADSGIANCPVVPTVPDKSTALVAQGSGIPLDVNGARKVVLEDLDPLSDAQQSVNRWATWLGGKLFPDDETWQQYLTQRLCILHDDLFAFLQQTATQVVARIRLKDDSKTVADDGLWYEESLPAETILSGLIIATPLPKVKLTPKEIFAEIATLTTTPAQFGGSATVGRGLCRLSLHGGD